MGEIKGPSWTQSEKANPFVENQIYWQGFASAVPYLQEKLAK